MKDRDTYTSWIALNALPEVLFTVVFEIGLNKVVLTYFNKSFAKFWTVRSEPSVCPNSISLPVPLQITEMTAVIFENPQPSPMFLCSFGAVTDACDTTLCIIVCTAIHKIAMFMARRCG